mmetsp:Transcript_20619/g.28947  ORF Transcript_20619/g.28947 Transcript_20619/m.28947 type:complete len:328 (-) Transcript_20619:24-1007(-)
MDIADKHTGHTHEGSSADDKDLLAVKIASIFIVFLCTLAGAIAPLRLRKTPDTNATVISCLNCLGGGIFLGFGFLHVLPDAIEGFETVDTNGFPLIYFLCLCGFFLILMAERYFITIAESISHPSGKGETDCDVTCACDTPSNDTEMIPTKSHDGHQHSHDFHTHAIPVNTKSPYLPFILTLGLSFHSIFEGLALSLNGEMTGLIVFLIGICVHKAAECFAMGVNFWRSQVPVKKWVGLTITYAAVTPAGIIIGLILSETLSGTALDIVSSILQAIAVGAFLYVAILGVVVEEFSNNANLLLKSFLFFVGLTCMGCLGILEIAEGSD